MPAEGAITTPEAGTRAPAAPAVALHDVTHRFRDVLALEGLSLGVRPDEVVAVVGPSGCGKTTLLELVCGLIEPSAGSVDSAPAVLMPQRDLLLPWLSALDNAALPLRVRGRTRKAARAAAAPLFAELGLGGFEAARPYELSGGMRQRVAFVRTLLARRPLLCLDEPFASLDAITGSEMQDWLAGALAAEPRSVLLVTHDVEEAVVLADRVLVLGGRPGRVVEELRVDVERPRDRTGEEVVALRAHALEALR